MIWFWHRLRHIYFFSLANNTRQIMKVSSTHSLVDDFLISNIQSNNCGTMNRFFILKHWLHIRLDHWKKYTNKSIYAMHALLTNTIDFQVYILSSNIFYFFFLASFRHVRLCQWARERFFACHLWTHPCDKCCVLCKLKNYWREYMY